MTTDTTQPAAVSAHNTNRRVPDYAELTRFYRAIGISAVAAAAQAARMTVPADRRQHALPAFLNDAHAVG